jgi:hypothetical protein
MTIEQTVEIPANRHVRLDFDVPAEIPAGSTKIELKFTPVTIRRANGEGSALPEASTRFPLKPEADEKKRRLARFCGIWTSGDLVEFDAVTKEFETIDESDWQ